MKKIAPAFLLLLTTATVSHAGQIGHYVGGMFNIRDYFVPAAPGVYGGLYNYYYTTDRLNDSKGREIDSVTVRPASGPGGLTIGVEPDVDVYVLAPLLMWATPYEILGARYAMLVVPAFANSSVGASLSTERFGIEPETSQFSLGDWYFQPLLLGWELEHFDFALGWGFYAPTGKYDTEVVTFPVVGDVTVAASDNIGLGFWTNQFQGSAAWYPWTNKGTAVTLVLTYEINSEKEDYDLTPGDNLSLNWGISQFLPITKDQKWLVELGPAGYDTWEVTSDSGRDAKNKVLDQVHGAGFQLGLTSVDWLGSVNFHYFYEVESKDRFQGHVAGLSIVKDLGKGW